MKSLLALLFVLAPFYSFAQIWTRCDCNVVLTPFNEVKKGEITSEVRQADAYYLDPRNNIGSLEQRRAKLDSVVRRVFNTFIERRTREYQSVVCQYRGDVRNKPKGYRWASLICQPGFVFVPSTLQRTTNGDWKKGPIFNHDNTRMDWRTGGHRSNKTYAIINAVYTNIPKRVYDELDIARQDLFKLGIPTKLPN